MFDSTDCAYYHPDESPTKNKLNEKIAIMNNVIKEMTLKISNLETELKEIKGVINKTEITETETV